MLLEVEDLILVQAALHDDRRERVVAVLLQLLQDLGCRNAGDLGERPQLLQLGGPALRQVGRPELQARPRDVRHEHVPVAVEDRAARRVDPQAAHPVVVRAGEVLVPGQHLQRPEAKEEHGEDGEREKADHRDAERELRGEAVRLLDSRVGRQEPFGRTLAASQGA